MRLISVAREIRKRELQYGLADYAAYQLDAGIRDVVWATVWPVAEVIYVRVCRLRWWPA